MFPYCLIDERQTNLCCDYFPGVDIAGDECFDSAVGIAECYVFDIGILAALALNDDEEYLDDRWELGHYLR